MIRVQPTTSGNNRFLIGSDLKDPAAAQHEVEQWVNHNNCVLPRNARHLSVFERGVLVREWILVERKPESVPVPPQNDPITESASVRLWNRNRASGENTIVLYPGAA